MGDFAKCSGPVIFSLTNPRPSAEVTAPHGGGALPRMRRYMAGKLACEQDS